MLLIRKILIGRWSKIHGHGDIITRSGTHMDFSAVSDTTRMSSRTWISSGDVLETFSGVSAVVRRLAGDFWRLSSVFLETFQWFPVDFQRFSSDLRVSSGVPVTF